MSTFTLEETFTILDNYLLSHFTTTSVRLNISPTHTDGSHKRNNAVLYKQLMFTRPTADATEGAATEEDATEGDATEGDATEGAATES